MPYQILAWFFLYLRELEEKQMKSEQGIKAKCPPN